MHPVKTTSNQRCFIIAPSIFTWLLLLLTTASYFIAGCKKGSDNGDTPTPVSPVTNIPVSEQINAGVTAHIINNSQNINQMYALVNGQYMDYDPNTRGFTINQTLLTTYQSKLKIDPSAFAAWYDVFKTWPQTKSIRNYIDFKLYNYTDVGVIGDVMDDASFTLPENGTIHFPPYSMYNNTSSFPFYLAAVFSKPADDDYALLLPCYPMADENKQRWFLNSYGTYLILQKSHQHLYNNMNFQGSNVLLKMPIDPQNVSTAPDSIAVWNMDNTRWVWQKSGYAYKVNNFYEKKIHQLGFWNFAVPQEGAYVNLHVRSANNIAVPNTRFKIKAGTYVVADQRTDADGNSIIFVPAGKTLSIDLLTENRYTGPDAQLTNINLGSFSKASEKTITLQDRLDVATLTGNVFNCDGSLLKEGVAKFIIKGYDITNKHDLVVPISNGHFSTALWVESDFGAEMANIDIVDNTGTSLVNYDVLLGYAYYGYPPQLNKHTVNFYTCLTAPKLFCNYKIDTTHYSVTANSADAAPVLTCTGSQVNIKHNDKEFVFAVNFNAIGPWTFPNKITINGISFKNFTTEGNPQFFITRRDPNIGGFVEGWFSFAYNDTNDVPHTLTGNFRLKLVG